MINVTFFFEAGNPDSERVEGWLSEIQPDLHFLLTKIDIHSEPALLEEYAQQVPCILVGPYRLTNPFQLQDLRVAIGAAIDRANLYTKSGDSSYKKRVDRGNELTGADRFSFWLSKHYMAVFNLLVAFYLGLPFLAPVMMKVGVAGPAKVIYTIYSPLCHQLAFRSYFLFGEQAYYPRQLAGISNVLTYEEISNSSQLDIIAARKFIGNDILGYKVALCERDVAIYGSMLIFGLIFTLTKRKIQSVPWYLWVVLGLIPIAVDGFSQIPGLGSNILPAWIPIRESTPFLRTLTGGLFGFFTAWYLYPVIEETMKETRRLFVRKATSIQTRQSAQEDS